VADRGDIHAAEIERLFDGYGQLAVAFLAAEADQLHHGPRAGLASLPFDQPLPDPIVAFGPSPRGSPAVARICGFGPNVLSDRFWPGLSAIAALLW
jgi:hypothetical protein